jgi:hypothetical protein
MRWNGVSDGLSVHHQELKTAYIETVYVKQLLLPAAIGDEMERRNPQEIFLVLIYVKRLSQPQGHSAAGRIMSMKNSNDTIGNRTCDLPACSAVPQPTAPPAACAICAVWGSERTTTAIDDNI